MAASGTARQKTGETVPERHRQLVHIQQGEVAFPALDAADVRPVQPGFSGQVAPASSRELRARCAHARRTRAESSALNCRMASPAMIRVDDDESTDYKYHPVIEKGWYGLVSSVGGSGNGRDAAVVPDHRRCIDRRRPNAYAMIW